MLSSCVHRVPLFARGSHSAEAIPSNIHRSPILQTPGRLRRNSRERTGGSPGDHDQQQPSDSGRRLNLRCQQKWGNSNSSPRSAVARRARATHCPVSDALPACDPAIGSIRMRERTVARAPRVTPKPAPASSELTFANQLEHVVKFTTRNGPKRTQTTRVSLAAGGRLGRPEAHRAEPRVTGGKGASRGKPAVSPVKPAGGGRQCPRRDSNPRSGLERAVT